jgi:hypothetical protein
MTLRMILALTLSLALAAVVAAQDFRRGFGFRGAPVRWATPESFDGSYSFCRLAYSGGGRRGGSWSTDYPDADINFSVRLSELTKTRVGRRPDGGPNHLIVRASDEELFKCPMVHMWEVGGAWLSDDEVARLREYLLKGGFLWVDDFWGTQAWEVWAEQLARILPSGEYPVQDLPLDHPLFRTVFEIKELPQVPSINHWWGTGGGTSERGYDSAEVHFRGISDRYGRLMVLMTHNTDISDSWEREGEDPQYFYTFSPKGYAVGINVLVYATSH